jgi:hypothetical protein
MFIVGLNGGLAYGVPALALPTKSLNVAQKLAESWFSALDSEVRNRAQLVLIRSAESQGEPIGFWVYDLAAGWIETVG